MKTYQTLYQNENRAIEITINDDDGQDFEPTSVKTYVLDSNGNTIIEEQDAMVSSNQAYTIIGTTVTATVGTYKLIWKIEKDSYIYYHRTDIEVYNI